MSSTERFGFEWEKYSALDANYEMQFHGWVAPLTEADFRDRRILDAGCGMGRNSHYALAWGAAQVVAFDYDQRSVAAARKNIGSRPQVQIHYRSIYELPWENEFDIVMCIGVLHHLQDPGRALDNLKQALKPGGRMIVWVYSYEGNEWIVRWVNPIRLFITSRLPVRMVHFLSYFCSVPLWLLVKIVRGPSPYLRQLSRFRFKHIHSIVFDQLIPRVANYWKHQELEQLFGGHGFKQVDIHRPSNQSGWTIIAVK